MGKTKKEPRNLEVEKIKRLIKTNFRKKQPISLEYKNSKLSIDDKKVSISAPKISLESDKCHHQF